MRQSDLYYKMVYKVKLTKMEQTLEDRELCVSGDTKLITRNGIDTIKNLVGKNVEIWNGEEWSEVKPFNTGSNRKLLKVTMSDGSYLKCTENHKWLVKPRKASVYRERQTIDLKIGDTIPRNKIEGSGGAPLENAYTLGFFSGDGYFDRNKPAVVLCGYNKMNLLSRIGGRPRKTQQPAGYKEPIQRVSLNGVIDVEIARKIKDRTIGLPEEILNANKESFLQFMAGWIDSDGNVLKQENGIESIRLYGEYNKLFDTQILLKKYGFEYVGLHLMYKKGAVTNKGTRNHDIWYLHFPSFYSNLIPTSRCIVTNVTQEMKKNPRNPNYKNISTVRRIRIVSIEEVEGLHDTYCLTENKRHMCTFNGILTKQCNLVEVFPTKHKDKNEFIHTLKYAYLYAKTVTLVPTHCERTNQVMLRNRRIGMSLCGVIDAFQKFGKRSFIEWMDDGYNRVNVLDKKYSSWLCIPESIKKTTEKPAGSVSLLAGVSPGIHYPHSEYYIRRIRVQNGSPLIKRLQKANIPNEPTKYNDNTVVFSFPVKSENFKKSKSDVTIWEQLENAYILQYYWSDNCISQTVTVKKEEFDQVADALETFEDRLKSISFLPLDEHGYEQAPYEEITKEQYEEMIKKIKPVDLSNIKIKEEDSTREKFCTGETCELNFAPVTES